MSESNRENGIDWSTQIRASTICCRKKPLALSFNCKRTRSIHATPQPIRNVASYVYTESQKRFLPLIFRFSIGVEARRSKFSPAMRAAGVAWPLQTAVIAFSRCAAVPVVTSRTLSVSFHALSSVQRHSRPIRIWRKDACRGCDSSEISLTRSRGSRRMVIRCLNRFVYFQKVPTVPTKRILRNTR